ncbi:hypothetical protein Pelo_18582 [Pelomyxa schiedti]|nr:hypothetical protein Pelo_18582 [Pelomyxa schiedti]
MVLCVVWDAVLMPWLVPKLPRPRLELTVKHAVALCVVVEALFPLRGLVCKALVVLPNRWHVALRAAVEAGSTSYVDWLIASRRRRNTAAREDEEVTKTDGLGEGGSPSTTMEDGIGRRRRENKEFMCVLGGLCAGGHLEEAQRLVGGDWPGLTQNRDQHAGLSSGVEKSGGETHYSGEQELAENVRASGILREVCGRGRRDTAKWLIQRFGIKDLWEFVGPLGSALASGHLELAQWMVGTFDLVERFKKHGYRDFHSNACESGNLEVVKWCFATFPQACSHYSTFMACIGGKRGSSEEICQYVSKHIELPHSLDPIEFSFIRRLDVLKWVMSELPGVIASVPLYVTEDFSGPIEFIKFFVEANLVTVTPELFLTVCRNFEDSTKLVKWLSTRLLLSQEDIDNSFVTALANSNTSIASWLEDAHHLLERHRGVTASRQLLVRVCKGIPSSRGGVSGLDWLLAHLDFSGTLQHQTGFVVDSVRDLLCNPKSTRVASLLLEKFPMIPEQDKSEVFAQALRESILQLDSLQQVQTIASMVENNIRGLTKECVSRGLESQLVRHSPVITQFTLRHFPDLTVEDITG